MGVQVVLLVVLAVTLATIVVKPLSVANCQSEEACVSDAPIQLNALAVKVGLVEDKYAPLLGLVLVGVAMPAACTVKVNG